MSTISMTYYQQVPLLCQDQADTSDCSSFPSAWFRHYYNLISIELQDSLQISIEFKQNLINVILVKQHDDYQGHLLYYRMKIFTLSVFVITLAFQLTLAFIIQDTANQLPEHLTIARQGTLDYYEKIINTLDPQARCLDGTPGLFYVHEGGDKANFLIFFEGGGLCGEQTTAKTVESCYQRSKTLLGSSTPWPDKLIAEGYLSLDQNINKFANYTKFIFGYCDGSLHQGFAPDPIKYKDALLYFRGAAITRSHFNWIDYKYNLKNANKIILTGGSAGGIAVHLWNNYLRSYVKNPDAVYSIDDSGVFINTKTTAGATKIQQMIQNTYKIANVKQSTPIAQCNSLYKNQEWKCLFIENAVTVLKGKYMIINSQYDSWAIPNILNVKCLKNSKLGGQTLENCTKIQLGHIESYRKLYKDTMTKFLTANSNTSIWSIACANHVYACINVFYDSPLQKVPEIVGKTVKQAVESFVLGNQRIISYDLEAWPANQGCAK